MAENKKSIYEALSKIDVKEYIETIPRTSKKTGQTVYLKYLSWPKAWGLVKAIYPDANYKIREFENWVKTPNGFQQAGTLDYRKTSIGTEVEVTVTIQDEEYTQKLYVMDGFNNPISNPTIQDVNKTQMRCLVKALAIAGLGLDIYAGEDLPSSEDETTKKASKARKQSLTSKSNTTSKPKIKTMQNEARLMKVVVKVNGKNIPLTNIAKGVAEKNESAIKISSNLKGDLARDFAEIVKLNLWKKVEG